MLIEILYYHLPISLNSAKCFGTLQYNYCVSKYYPSSFSYLKHTGVPPEDKTESSFQNVVHFK
jgi:hypothetical protein